MAIVAVVLAGCLALYSAFAWFYGWNGGTPSYIAFVFHRSQSYYSRFADACDELMTQIGTNQYEMKPNDPHMPDILRYSKANDFGFSNVCEMAGDDPRLPAQIRQVKPAILLITTNRVWLYMDVRAPYAIMWETDYVDPKAMVLTVYGDAPPQRVFLRTNSVTSSAVPAR